MGLGANSLAEQHCGLKSGERAEMQTPITSWAPRTPLGGGRGWLLTRPAGSAQHSTAQLSAAQRVVLQQGQGLQQPSPSWTQAAALGADKMATPTGGRP